MSESLAPCLYLDRCHTRPATKTPFLLLWGLGAMRLILPTGPVPRQSDLHESGIFCVFFFIYSLSYVDIFLLSWMNANVQTEPTKLVHMYLDAKPPFFLSRDFWE